MKRFSSSLMASFALSVVTGCFGVGDEDLAQDPTGAAGMAGEVASTSQALGTSCGIEPNGQAFCAATAVPTILGRSVYYRLGANTGPGYDPATGAHSAVFLFQGSNLDSGTMDTGGGSTGPGATFGFPQVKPGNFAVWHQVATVIALVDAGYTVIQAAAHAQSPGYFWDTNKKAGAGFNGGNAWNGSPDQALMNALIAQIQPGMTTFGLVDINHVYCTGISSGGYMCSRLANEYAGGVNNDSTVKNLLKPIRAVFINSAAYQVCAGNSVPGSGFLNTKCISTTNNAVLPAAHAPVAFLHAFNPTDNVVPLATKDAYVSRLNQVFGGVNSNYVVNGVPQTFVQDENFDNTGPGGSGGHAWSVSLTAGPDNKILQWFNSHR